MEKMMILCLLLGAATVSAQTVDAADTVEQTEYTTMVRERLALDYSMPDYTVGKIDAKTVGPRLASILESFCKNYTQNFYLSKLSQLQCQQIEGLNYATIKSMKLRSVQKRGNEIAILFNTILEPNWLGIKKSDLTFTFVDGVSENRTVNDLFLYLCHYLKE